MNYSACAMFITHDIPSFYELLCKCIYNVQQFLNVLVVAETLGMPVANNIYVLTSKTLVAISTILILVNFICF